MRIAVPVLLCCLLTSLAQAADDSVRTKTVDGVVYVHSGDLAKSLDFKLERLQDGQLLTFCREGQGGVCIPVRLSASNHRKSDGDVYLAAPIVSSALQVRAVADGDSVRLEALSLPQANNVPSYNAKWGKGRGFGVGDTLPDIPLVDMDGKEVRFSRFLGKKYILYCWASW